MSSSFLHSCKFCARSEKGSESVHGRVPIDAGSSHEWHSCGQREPLSLHPRETVISPEAAHGVIVSSAVEKSAFLPPAFANPHRALVFAPALAVIVAVA